MSKYLNEAGLAYYDGKQKERLAQKADVTAVPTKLSQLSNDAGFLTGADADTFAKKSDLTSVYRYKGSVADAADLPASENTVGDVWNVEATGMNYAWTGSGWDALGEALSVESITNSEIDAITTEG